MKLTPLNMNHHRICFDVKLHFWSYIFYSSLNCLHPFVLETTQFSRLRLTRETWPCETWSTHVMKMQSICRPILRIVSIFDDIHPFKWHIASELNQFTKDAFAYLNGNLFGDCVILCFVIRLFLSLWMRAK